MPLNIVFKIYPVQLYGNTLDFRKTLEMNRPPIIERMLLFGEAPTDQGWAINALGTCKLEVQSPELELPQFTEHSDPLEPGRRLQ
jgi:hypothetical protein